MMCACGGKVEDVRAERTFAVSGRRVTVLVGLDMCVRCGSEYWTDDQITRAQHAVHLAFRAEISFASFVHEARQFSGNQHTARCARKRTSRYLRNGGVKR